MKYHIGYIPPLDVSYSYFWLYIDGYNYTWLGSLTRGHFHKRNIRMELDSWKKGFINKTIIVTEMDLDCKMNDIPRILYPEFFL